MPLSEMIVVSGDFICDLGASVDGYDGVRGDVALGREM